MTDWGVIGSIERSWYRAHNVCGRVTLNLGDDTQKMQTHQIEGYTDELRDNMQRVQRFGHSTMPLPGCTGVAIYQSGHRGWATVIADEDPRYRPTGLNPGETQSYMVDGAKRDGTGGTTRVILQGLLGWVTNIFGKTINHGDKNTSAINIGIVSESITIDLGSSNATVNITGGSGDVMVNGVSLVNHVHSNAGGSGDSGPPVQS